MESLLASTIYGKEFLKFRIYRTKEERCKLSQKIINDNYIPIVIDTIDTDLQINFKKLQLQHCNGKLYKFNKEYIIEDLLCYFNNELHINNQFVINFGLETGRILTKNEYKTFLSEIYRKYKNSDDNILYLLITKETTWYDYLLSIVKYIYNTSTFSIQKLLHK